MSTCATCDTPVPPGRVYCTNRCRQKAYRHRHAVTVISTESKRNAGRPRTNLALHSIIEAKRCSRTHAYRLWRAQMEQQPPVAKGNLGKQQVKAGVATDRANRHRDDFYATPPRATLALLEAEEPFGGFPGTTWEPACGDGAISKVFEAAGHNVISTDLIDRGYGTSGVDFLLDYQTVADNIVTNPPFKLATDFIEHALARTKGKVALLLRSASLQAQERAPLINRCARIWPLSKRPQTTRGGYTGKTTSPIHDFSWCVWDPNHHGPTQTVVLLAEAGFALAEKLGITITERLVSRRKRRNDLA